MPNSYNGKNFSFSGPAKYTIEVQGQVDENWSEHLSGMHIDVCTTKDRKILTTLTGRVKDQAELMGVLNSLYELHVMVLSVKIFNGE